MVGMDGSSGRGAAFGLASGWKLGHLMGGGDVVLAV